MADTSAPPSTDAPSVDRLRREGVRLYLVGNLVSVWMLPDRSTWILTYTRAGGRPRWTVEPRTIWED